MPVFYAKYGNPKLVAFSDQYVSHGDFAFFWVTLPGEDCNGAHVQLATPILHISAHFSTFQHISALGIFDRLDFKSVGRVTLVGFYVIVEASAPVRSVEDLRRRWLACRYTMLQAIMIMADNSHVALTHRLTLQEFGSRLQLVNVNDPEEHLAVFKAVCHETDKDIKAQGGQGVRVMLGDLAAALAVVSPCLLLEDLRDRLQRRYNGDFKKAFSDLDMDRSGKVSHAEFVVKIMDRLHLTEHEARKMFREIDVDGSHEISRNEFVSAIGLSEPSLFLEDLRKKVRQRFRSFKAQFADSFQDSRCAMVLFAEVFRGVNPKLP